MTRTTTNIPMPSSGARAQEHRKIERLAAEAGINLPQKYTAATSAHAATLRRANVLLQVNKGEFSASIVDALAGDRDPMQDAAVTGHAVRAAIATRAPAINAALREREGQIIRDHRAAIVKAAGKPISAALEAIAHAVTEAPSLAPDAPAEHVLKSGATASGAWTAARDAQQALDAATGLVRALGYRVDAREHAWLYVRVPASEPLPGESLRSAWSAALAGGELEWVGDMDGYRARLAEVEELAERVNAPAPALAHPRRRGDVELVAAEAELMRKRARALDRAAGGD